MKSSNFLEREADHKLKWQFQCPSTATLNQVTYLVVILCSLHDLYKLLCSWSLILKSDRKTRAEGKSVTKQYPHNANNYKNILDVRRLEKTYNSGKFSKLSNTCVAHRGLTYNWNRKKLKSSDITLSWHYSSKCQTNLLSFWFHAHKVPCAWSSKTAPQQYANWVLGLTASITRQAQVFKCSGANVCLSRAAVWAVTLWWWPHTEQDSVLPSDEQASKWP